MVNLAAPGFPEGQGAEDYILFQGSAAGTDGKDPLEVDIGRKT